MHTVALISGMAGVLQQSFKEFQLQMEILLKVFAPCGRDEGNLDTQFCHYFINFNSICALTHSPLEKCSLFAPCQISADFVLVQSHATFGESFTKTEFSALLKSHLEGLEQWHSWYNQFGIHTVSHPSIHLYLHVPYLLFFLHFLLYPSSGLLYLTPAVLWSHIFPQCVTDLFGWLKNPWFTFLLWLYLYRWAFTHSLNHWRPSLQVSSLHLILLSSIFLLQLPFSSSLSWFLQWLTPSLCTPTLGFPLPPSHLVPMFLYWHSSRFLNVFLNVALHSA